MRTAIVGGGAAGFFLAINLKEMCPQMDVTIFEKSKKVLAKVEVSGGGRCNCTNSFDAVSDLSQVYPRGQDPWRASTEPLAESQSERAQSSY